MICRSAGVIIWPGTPERVVSRQVCGGGCLFV